MNDSLGTPMEIWDLVLSSSTTHGRVKFGRVVQGKNGLLMSVLASFHWGEREIGHPKRGQFGQNVIVLEKADGAIPDRLGEIYE